MLEKLTKLLTLLFPIRRTARDKMNCLLSLAIQKNKKRTFKIIIKGVSKLNIVIFEKRDGFIYGRVKENKNKNAINELTKKRNCSKKLSFFIYFLLV